MAATVLRTELDSGSTFFVVGGHWRVLRGLEAQVCNRPNVKTQFLTILADMKDAELFLQVRVGTDDENWYENINAALCMLPGVEAVQIVKAEDSSIAQLMLGYSTEQITLDQIDSRIKDFGSQVTEMVISLSPGISGAADVYSASAFALPIREQIGDIRGVKSAGISDRGWIKIELDGNLENKHVVLSKVLVEVFKINLANPSVSDL